MTLLKKKLYLYFYIFNLLTGLLVLRYHKFGASAVVKQLPWQQDDGITCMTFDPSGAWLLCVSCEAKLCIVPALAILVKYLLFSTGYIYIYIYSLIERLLLCKD